MGQPLSRQAQTKATNAAAEIREKALAIWGKGDGRYFPTLLVLA